MTHLATPIGGRALISSTETLIEDARAGRPFILLDAADRENEGDIVVPAAACDAAMVNFMITHARGLVCLALVEEQAERLGLQPMTANNRAPLATAFTVSIEAATGVTTGISAADRARTIAIAIDPYGSAQDVVTPGHMFPIVARPGGVLERPGHTEAAVDFARLAGQTPAGVICEILNADGSMARLPDLVVFAARHGLNLGTIADLIAYRERTGL